MSERHEAMPSLWQLACGDGTPRAACGVAIVVGTVLTLINHGDVIIAGHMPDPLKVALTYAVPYVVATYGAVTAKRAAWRMRLAVQAEKTRP